MEEMGEEIRGLKMREKERERERERERVSVVGSPKKYELESRDKSRENNWDGAGRNRLR